MSGPVENPLLDQIALPVASPLRRGGGDYDDNLKSNNEDPWPQIKAMLGGVSRVCSVAAFFDCGNA